MTSNHQLGNQQNNVIKCIEVAGNLSGLPHMALAG